MVVAVTDQGIQGDQTPSAAIHTALLELAFDNSYPTGGELVDIEVAAINIPVENVRYVTFGDAWLGYVPEWDQANKKVLLRRGAGAIDLPLAEVANAFDVSAIIAGKMFVHHD